MHKSRQSRSKSRPDAPYAIPHPPATCRHVAAKTIGIDDPTHVSLNLDQLPTEVGRAWSNHAFQHRSYCGLNTLLARAGPPRRATKRRAIRKWKHGHYGMPHRSEPRNRDSSAVGPSRLATEFRPQDRHRLIGRSRPMFGRPTTKTAPTRLAGHGYTKASKSMAPAGPILPLLAP